MESYGSLISHLPCQNYKLYASNFHQKNGIGVSKCCMLRFSGERLVTWSQAAGVMILLNDLFAVTPMVNVANAAIAGAIAGGIIGAVLIVLCVGGVLIGWLYDRRKKHIAELQRLDILSRYFK